MVKRLVPGAVALLMIGGCAMTDERGDAPRGSASGMSVSEGRYSEAFHRFMQTQQVHVDLTTPPTREEVGLGPESTAVIVGRTGDKMLDVKLALPEGKQLHVPAFGVVFSADLDGRRDLPPREIVVNRRFSDLAAAHEALVQDGRAIGIDDDETERWYADMTAGSLPEAMSRNFEVELGYMRANVEVIIRAGQDDLINYTFLWDPETAPSTSAGGTA